MSGLSSATGFRDLQRDRQDDRRHELGDPLRHPED